MQKEEATAIIHYSKKQTTFFFFLIWGITFQDGGVSPHDKDGPICWKPFLP